MAVSVVRPQTATGAVTAAKGFAAAAVHAGMTLARDIEFEIVPAALAKLLESTPWEIGASIHPHPTVSESLKEAALAVDGMAIHI